MQEMILWGCLHYQRSKTIFEASLHLQDDHLRAFKDIFVVIIYLCSFCSLHILLYVDFLYDSSDLDFSPYTYVA